jgi:serine/threonine-protein kinase
MAVSPTGAQPYNETVTLTVSQGKVQVTVPDVTGQSLTQATATLTAAGLQITSSTFITGDKVVRQSPGKGETVDQGTTVSVLLSFL